MINTSSKKAQEDIKVVPLSEVKPLENKAPEVKTQTEDSYNVEVILDYDFDTVNPHIS